MISISLPDVVQLLFGQELRDYKLVPPVPLTSHCNIHISLPRFREGVVLYFFARGATSEENIGALSRVFTGFEERHRLATLQTT